MINFDSITQIFSQARIQNLEVAMSDFEALPTIIYMDHQLTHLSGIEDKVTKKKEREIITKRPLYVC